MPGEVVHLVAVSVDGGKPMHLPSRYGQMVREIVALLPKMQGMGTFQLEFHCRQARGGDGVSVSLKEIWPNGVTAGQGFNIAA